jgi:hypothetical protein
MRAPKIEQVALLSGTMTVCCLLLFAGCGNGPNAQAVEEYASGGLGLTRAQWERNHTSVEGYLYDASDEHPRAGYWIDFWTQQYPAPDDAVISRILVDARFILTSTQELAESESYIHFDRKQAAVRTLLPADAQLESSRTTPASSVAVVETYYSPSLSSRYPSLPDEPDPWGNEKPGTIQVTYGYDPLVVITAGRSGEPPRPLIEPSATPTMPEPTLGPYDEPPGPPPVPTFPNSLSPTIPIPVTSVGPGEPVPTP